MTTGRAGAQHPLDAVVFDLGNVVVQWDPAAAVAGRMSAQEWQEVAEAIDFPALNARADAGERYAQLVSELQASHGEDAEVLEHYRHYLTNVGASFPGPVPGTTAIIEELLDSGVRVLGLTNWSGETVHFAAQAAPIVARMEALVVSGRERIVKPDPRIYRILLARHGLAAPRTVFVDDRMENVRAAQGEGMIGIQFTDAENLRTDLTARGLLSPGSPR